MPKGESEKAKMKKEKEDKEEEGEMKDRKRISINPLEISPPLNFAPRPSRTPVQGGTYP